MRKTPQLALSALTLAVASYAGTASAYGYLTPYYGETYAQAGGYEGTSDFDQTMSPAVDIGSYASAESDTAQSYVDGYSVGASASSIIYDDVPPPYYDSLNVLKSTTEIVKEPIYCCGPDYHAYASAEVSQDFTVVGAGTATFSFAWDGQLYSPNENALAGYEFQANVGYPRMMKQEFLALTEDLPAGIYDSEEVVNGTANVNKTQNITVDFTESDIGDIFTVSMFLAAWTDNHDYSDYEEGFPSLFNTLASIEEAQNPIAFADFFHTGTFSFSGQGVIAPAAVPVPAAVWLFGSALVGLVGFRRKQRS